MEEMQAKVEQSLRKRFKKELFNNFCKAIDEYDLIQAGDKIAVCISGGKDSMLMAKLFQELQRRWAYRENRIKKDEIFRLRNQDCSAQNDIKNNDLKINVQNENKNNKASGVILSEAKVSRWQNDKKDEILRLATLAQNDIKNNDNKKNNDIKNNDNKDIKNNENKNLQCHTDQTRTTVRVRGSISKNKDEILRLATLAQNDIKKNDKNEIGNDENKLKNGDKQQGFELVFLVMDPGYNKANRKMIEQNAKQLGVPITIFETDIFNSVVNVEKSPCYLCARMRRGYLYSKAKELGCNKIALGHHYNDVIETILMGMLFSGQFQTMLPKLNSTNFEGMQLIRPMYLIKEKDILHWRDYCGLKFLQCACRFTEQTNYSTCTQTDNIENELSFDSDKPTKEETSMRKFTKQLIAKLNKLYPQIETNIFKSVENVNLSTLISYKDKSGTHSFKDNL